LKFLYYGKAIEEGIKFYYNDSFCDAKMKFIQAAKMNSKDFTVNFWLARVSFMLNENQAGLMYIKVCKQLKPKLTSLIEPWESLIENQGKNKIESLNTIKLINSTSDQLLDSYYRNMDYNLLNSVVGTLVVSLILIGVYGIAPRLEAFNGVIVAIILMGVGLRYFCKKTKLSLDFYRRCKMAIRDAKKLYSKYLYEILVGFIVLMVAKFFIDGIITNFDLNEIKSIYGGKYEGERFYFKILKTSPVFLIFYIIAGGILEEFLMRYVWFNYFVKKGIYRAYIYTAILFSLGHMSILGLNHIVTSLIFTYYYDKYKTIIAPITLHILYNLALDIIVYISIVP